MPGREVDGGGRMRIRPFAGVRRAVGGVRVRLQLEAPRVTSFMNLRGRQVVQQFLSDLASPLSPLQRAVAVSHIPAVLLLPAPLSFVFCLLDFLFLPPKVFLSSVAIVCTIRLWEELQVPLLLLALLAGLWSLQRLLRLFFYRWSAPRAQHRTPRRRARPFSRGTPKAPPPADPARAVGSCGASSPPPRPPPTRLTASATSRYLWSPSRPPPRAARGARSDARERRAGAGSGTAAAAGADRGGSARPGGQDSGPRPRASLPAPAPARPYRPPWSAPHCCLNRHPPTPPPPLPPRLLPPQVWRRRRRSCARSSRSMCAWRSRRPRFAGRRSSAALASCGGSPFLEKYMPLFSKT
jgi:hypothetical protein